MRSRSRCREEFFNSLDPRPLQCFAVHCAQPLLLDMPLPSRRRSQEIIRAQEII